MNELIQIPVSPVRSSNVVAIGHDAASKTLRVKFQSGTYDYAGVESAMYSECMRAKSIGSFIASQIKGKYKATRIDKPAKPG